MVFWKWFAKRIHTTEPAIWQAPVDIFCIRLSAVKPTRNWAVSVIDMSGCGDMRPPWDYAGVVSVSSKKRFEGIASFFRLT